MSTVRRPRGPLPARVYWVRRGLVLAIVFGLVFVMARVVGGDDDEKSAAEQAAGALKPQVTQEPDVAATTGKKPKKVKPPLAQPDGPCDPAEVTVTPTIRSERATPAISLPLELTTERAACTFQLSSATVALKILSGKDQIWTSQQCPAVLGTHDLVVRKAQPATAVITWNGRRSAKDCAKDTDWADLGGYHAIAAAFGGEPVDQYFELTKPKTPVIIKTRKPKLSKADKAKAEKTKKRKKKGSTPTEERATGNGAQEPSTTRH